MRKLGMIGGMSWASTALYYEAINKGVARQRGGLTSAPLLIESLEFGAVAALQEAGDWDALAAILIDAATRLERAGAEGLILCSNTSHKHFDKVAAKVALPMIHIGDVAARQLTADGIRRAGLIGTRFTMAELFYRDRLEGHGIAVSVPDAAMRTEIDRIIFDELARGRVTRESQRTLKSCLAALMQGSDAVVLGCTELVMLVDPRAARLPVYDTTALHAAAAVEWILGGDDGVAARAGTLKATA